MIATVYIVGLFLCGVTGSPLMGLLWLFCFPIVGCLIHE